MRDYQQFYKDDPRTMSHTKVYAIAITFLLLQVEFHPLVRGQYVKPLSCSCLRTFSLLLEGRIQTRRNSSGKYYHHSWCGNIRVRATRDDHAWAEEGYHVFLRCLGSPVKQCKAIARLLCISRYVQKMQSKCMCEHFVKASMFWDWIISSEITLTPTLAKIRSGIGAHGWRTAHKGRQNLLLNGLKQYGRYTVSPFFSDKRFRPYPAEKYQDQMPNIMQLATVLAHLTPWIWQQQMT